MFTSRGIRVGVTIRPQNYTGTTQEWVPDSIGKFEISSKSKGMQIVSDKIQYAKNRWNATIFYLDSNNGLQGEDAIFLKAVVMANPDVLIFPELETTLHYSFSVPYNEFR